MIAKWIYSNGALSGSIFSHRWTHNNWKSKFVWGQRQRVLIFAEDTFCGREHFSSLASGCVMLPVVSQMRLGLERRNNCGVVCSTFKWTCAGTVKEWNLRSILRSRWTVLWQSERREQGLNCHPHGRRSAAAWEIPSGSGQRKCWRQLFAFCHHL